MEECQTKQKGGVFTCLKKTMVEEDRWLSLGMEVQSFGTTTKKALS